MPVRFALWLVLLILFSPAASTAQSNPKREELRQRLDSAVDARDWKQVVEIGEELDRIGPPSSVVAFEVACAYAQLSAPERSVEWLQKAADRGYQGITRLDGEPALDSVRTLPGFTAARDAIAARRKEGFERFRQAASEATPLVVWPDGKPGKVKMILLALHGAGGTGKEMADVWKDVARKHQALLIAPDALRPAGSGYAWVFMDEGEWWVLENVKRARAQWNLPDTPVVLTGYSQGANLALRIGALHPEVFRGVIIVNGHYEPHLAPVPTDAKSAPRFFLLAGDQDPAVGTLRDAEKVFKKAGLRVKLQTFPGGHQFPQSEGELGSALDFALSGK